MIDFSSTFVFLFIDFSNFSPRVRHFVPDERKSGGAYVTVTGVVRHISITERVLVMKSGTEITMEDVDSVVF